jgi:hypothetical protein
MSDHLSNQERLLRKHVASHRCPLCRKGYQQEHVRVAARADDLWAVSVRCASCRRQQVYWMSIADLKLTDEMKVDPSPEEEAIFNALPPVGSDDILDMYLFLDEFDGDFRGLFSDRSHL